ncbi:putative leucine-rich repeat-containing protein DDB_G0290503 [Plodia interpunctella]|uniref:putative leucine-rich repeat-containing protein DDB_G0290503 n=1 Tax=Plodia interpunctella TaxID=58824 RepID=UPI0023677657|nr:putative leucine-rich repeat-containing protein DDB_G0290503 [Plodia interpunctella]
METVSEEGLVQNPSVEGVKSTNISSETSDAEVCQKSNGVSETLDKSLSNLENNSIDRPVEFTNTSCRNDAESEIQDYVSNPIECSESSSSNIEITHKISPNDSNITEVQLDDSIEQSAEPNKTEVSTTSNVQNPELVENRNSVKDELVKVSQNDDLVNNEKVKFETEILVETNDNDVNELDLNTTNEVGSQESTSNILSELSQSIELSEALRASDNAGNVENNNHSVRQEVFNKEELLDILEGNDIQTSDAVVGYEIEIKLDTPDGKSEAQLALEQLSRLKKSRNRKRRSSGIISRKRNINVLKAEANSDAIVSKKEDVKSKKEDVAIKPKKVENKEKAKKDSKAEDSIVNKLVEDWDDDEPVDDETDLNNKGDSILNSTEQVEDAHESIVSQDVTARMSVDSAVSDSATPNKGSEDGQPQRRLGRVIKKKVIYDPDNPDTFTKSKISVKKEPQAEDSPSKKVKSESTVPRPKSKSPISKLQWKKPQPKNSKQNRRLTEVDKLLMDEGAVNMIYQLTPEAPKGKKNMRTKAEFIKKIQSSNPETKEMKFRERKVKIEEGEAKKIMGNKQRPSLSSSVKSSICEDFETHSADDSIIYRRHSSSSYSSTCMSPRRLSDVEGGSIQSCQNKSTLKETVLENDKAPSDMSAILSTDVFVPDVSNLSTDIINKDDCLSIKEKLNSKLSLALNKRKRESSKSDKPIKHRKLSKVDQKVKQDDDKYKLLSISYAERVAEILIRKTGSKYSHMMFKELCQALEEVDARTDISVTLLMSECGTLCSDLDLSSLVNDDIEERTNSAYEYAEDIRLVLFAMIQHSKLLVTGVWGSCSGVAPALLALSDVALASEAATFELASGDRPVLPGVMLLSSPWQALPQTLVNDLVIFGCKLSAREVAAGGLVSRVLRPRGAAPVRQLARDLAVDNNPKNILLKKRLLNLKNASNTFLSCLIKERDLIINYWTSTEGQELLRASITA